MLDFVVIIVLIFYILTIYGIFILRKKRPDAERPYKVWGYPFVPVTYIILASIVAVGILWSQWDIAINGLMIVALGYPIYFLFNRKKNVVS